MPPFRGRSPCAKPCAPSLRTQPSLATAAGAAAAHASVAAAVSGHDAAAEAAAGGVAQVDYARQGIGGVDWTSDFGLRDCGVRRRIDFCRAFLLRRGCGPQPQILKQHLLLAGQEAQLDPAEDVVHDALGVADVRIAGPSARLKACVGEFFAEQLQRNAVLQRDGDGQREAVHQAAHRGSFFCHGDEELARLAIGIEADGDVSLVVSDFEFVGDGGAFFLQLVAHGSGWGIQIFFFHLTGGRRPRCPLSLRLRRLCAGGAQRLALLAAIPVNRHRLKPQFPGLQVGIADVFDGGVLGKIDGLRYSSGDERLRSRHHPQMPGVVNRPSAFRRLERAIKDGQVIILNMRRPLNRSGSVDVADDRIRLLMRVSKLEQSRRHRIVDDLNHPSAHQLLVLHQRQIRLYASSIAVHHEAYGAGGG